MPATTCGRSSYRLRPCEWRCRDRHEFDRAWPKYPPALPSPLRAEPPNDGSVPERGRDTDEPAERSVPAPKPIGSQASPGSWVGARGCVRRGSAGVARACEPLTALRQATEEATPSQRWRLNARPWLWPAVSSIFSHVYRQTEPPVSQGTHGRTTGRVGDYLLGACFGTTTCMSRGWRHQHK